jgi:hypothetical protein
MSTLFGDEISTTQGKKSNEWYTPHHIIAAAREVMGGIDLDPASCELANQTVKASTIYTKEDNGLSKPWHGRIWLNPPYGRFTNTGRQTSWQGTFIKKLLTEWDAGNVEQAIVLLLGNACFARYFPPLWDYPLCFFDGSLVFYREDGRREDFGFGTIFVYLGPNNDKFASVFSRFGRIVKAIDTPKQAQVVQHDLWSNGSEVA